MKRTAMNFLIDWLKQDQRKPLVIRGARQVGKTWLVRDFARSERKELIEINFEKTPRMASLFESNDPQQIILNLSAAMNRSIDLNTSLLFLDEIQAVPDLLAKLRWFAEDMADLPVIAAGSLLEFVLETHVFSMPVGRINYMHLEPLSFEEFLGADGKEKLLEYLKNYEWGKDIPSAIHEQLITCFKEYLIIGGMPIAVSTWIKKKSLRDVNQVHSDLIATYRDDIAKYRGRIATERVDEVMMAVPKYLGEKFAYTRVNPQAQITSIKQALDLLCKARVCHRISGCSANGIPLGAETQDKYLKVIFLDVGLCSAVLGLSLDQLYLVDELTLVNSGGIAEQVVGQMLRTIFLPYVEPSLFYWHRNEKSSNAEIDYVIQHRHRVVPIEVKAGRSGSLKSLQLFMGLKGLSTAVRINSDFPSQTAVNVKDGQGGLVSYTLLSFPFYLLGQLHRILDTNQLTK